MGVTSGDLAPGVNTVEGTYHRTVGDSGKYNTSSATMGHPPIENDLDGNGTAAEGRGIFQRYRVGGGDLEGVNLHHEQSPTLHLIAKLCST